MSFENTYIPYGGYWSTPFCRWQESLAEKHSIQLAGQVAKSFLGSREIDPTSFEALHLGTTVLQSSGFYGAPWLASMLGADMITGPTVSQACATSARLLAGAALETETGLRSRSLLVACDRTSNGPHVYYPAPNAPGGTGRAENVVMDSFNRDPNAKVAMIQTAENVAKRCNIGREEQDEVALMRYQQYGEALADDRAFQKRYMVPVELPRGRRESKWVEADEGVFPTTAEGLAGLRPVMEGGTVTFGSQTHPADGNAGMIVTSKDAAKELSRDNAVTIKVLSYGEARVEKAHMPMAVVPAAQHALQRAGLKFSDLKAIKTHNPFAVNDVYFARETGVAASDMNRFGSPMIWGHPQGPMGLRAIIELIEELVLAGGGRGLFAGCAAGDTAMAVTIEVS